jgi:hypothetical protein
MNQGDWEALLESGVLPAAADKQAEVTLHAPSLAGGVIRDRGQLVHLLRKVYPGATDLTGQVVALLKAWEGRATFSPPPHGPQTAWLRWLLFANDPLADVVSATQLFNAIVAGARITKELRDLLQSFYLREMFRGADSSEAHFGEPLRLFMAQQEAEARDMAKRMRAYKHAFFFELPLEMTPHEETLPIAGAASDVTFTHRVTLANGVEYGNHAYVPAMRERIKEMREEIALADNLNTPEADRAAADQRRRDAIDQLNGLLYQEQQIISAFARQKRLEASIRNHPFLADKLAVEKRRRHDDDDETYKKDLFIETLRGANPVPPTQRDLKQARHTRRDRMRNHIHAGMESKREESSFGKSSLYFK